jgi:PilZ domain
MVNTENQIRPMLLSEEQLRGLLNQLDGAVEEPEKDVRRTGRLTYRTANVTVHVLTGSDQVTGSFSVPTRNISASGLAFLHKQMMPLRQRLRIDIPMVDDRMLCVMAEVMHFRHVQGMVHEIGVHFLSIVEQDT